MKTFRLAVYTATTPILTILLLLLSGTILAQTEIESSPPIYEEVAYVFENIDFSEVATDILIDKGIGIGTFEEQTGDLSNLKLADVNTFGCMYADLYASATDNSALLPDPSTAYMDAVIAYQEGQTIPFLLLAYRYHQFKSDALTSDLISTSNGQLFDVPNRTTTPYEEKQVFVASPIVHRSKSPTVTFSFDASQEFSNFENPFTQIAIDFSDGQGFQIITLGQNKTVQFLGSGKQDITIRWTLADGTQHYALTYIYIEEQVQSRYNEDISAVKSMAFRGKIKR